MNHNLMVVAGYVHRLRRMAYGSDQRKHYSLPRTGVNPRTRASTVGGLWHTWLYLGGGRF